MKTIQLDITNKTVIPLLNVKQGDVRAKFKVQLTDGGAAYQIPSGAKLSVWYSGASGEGNYSTIDGRSAFLVSNDTIAVELIAQMLTHKGGGRLCLVMNKADGTQIGLWNIPYYVEEVPGSDSEEAKSFYTAFSEAAAEVKQAVDAAENAAERAVTTACELKEMAGQVQMLSGHIDSIYECEGLDDISMDKMLLNIVTKLESGKQHRCLIHVNQDGMALERGWWFFEITRKDRYVQIHGILGSKEVYRTFITCSNLVHNITSSAFNFGNDTDGDGKADYFGEDLNPANTWVDKNASAFIPFDTTGSNRDKGYAWARDTHGWFYYPMRGTNLYKLHPAYQNFDNTAPWEWTDMCAGITESAYLNTTQGYITYRAISNGNEPYFALKLRVYETGKYTVKIDTGAHGTSNMHFYLIPEAQLGDGGRKELSNNAYKLGNIDISNNEMVKTFEIELHEAGYYYLVTFIDSDGVGDRASAEAGTAYLKSVTLSLETDGDVGGFFSEWAKSDAVLMPGTGVDSLVHRVSEPGNSGNDPRPKATARGAVSLGRYTKTHAKEGFTAGASNIVGEEGDPEVGRNGFAINNGNKVMGDNGTAIGHCNEIPHTYPRGDVPDHVVEAAFVSGMYNKAVRSAQAVFGMFNDPDVEALIIVGNGTKGKLANAYVLKEDGRQYVYGNPLPMIHSGSGTPDDSLGMDGDIYIQFEE